MSHVHLVVGPKPHAHNVWLYWIVFFTLVFFTFLTVNLAHFDFGKFSIIITLLIAGTKAILVMAFFMHLAFDNKFLALVAGTSLMFLALLIISCVLDMDSRAEVDIETQNFLPRDEKIYKHSLDNPKALPLRPKLEEASPEKLIFIKPGEH